MTVNPTRTVPSLQGTCHKHTSKRYKPNLWQEPFSPSRPNASQRDSAANLTDNELNKQNQPVPNKRSYAIGVLVVYQAFQLASWFVTGDTDTAPKSTTAHTATVSHYCIKKIQL